MPVNVIIYSYIRIIKTMRDNALRSGRVNKVENRVTSMIFVMIIGESPFDVLEPVFLKRFVARFPNSQVMKFLNLKGLSLCVCNRIFSQSFKVLTKVY